MTNAGKKYLWIFFSLILLPYVLGFIFLKIYDPDGFFITAWIILVPIVAYPIWLKKLKAAKLKEKQLS